ncbi:MAG: glycosyltransferase family 2 protein [Phycisphaeraceae bacterium]
MYGFWVFLLSIAFAAAMAVVVAYSIHRAWCVLTWWRGQKGQLETHFEVPVAVPLFIGRSVGQAPGVTVQLPMFNEAYVAERVIRAACAMDWPRDRLQIQVLDDSTDQTSAIVALCCRELAGEGYFIEHLRRPDRAGYKAGALRDAMMRAKGDLIAIFDADFVPPRDFLQRTIPAFFDREVGMVQACWSHLNEQMSQLTRTQAMLLDGHFLIEHTARHASDRWFNFNGTAGIWRREAIERAGSWQSDTLTEDVDLSYRAQLLGWRFVYLPTLQCPAELPCRMVDLRAQQWRWTAGSISAARKLLRPIWQSEQPRHRQIEATAHLLGPTVYVALLALAVGLGPTLWLLGSAWAWLLVGLMLIAAIGSAATFYLAAAVARGREPLAAAAHLPWLLMLAVGLSVSNTTAVVAALLGRTGGFKRTPKVRATDKKNDWRRRMADLRTIAREDNGKRHAPPPTSPPTSPSASTDAAPEASFFNRPTGLVELGMSAWCATWAVICLTWWPGLWAAALLGLFSAGFAWVGWRTLQENIAGAEHEPDDAIASALSERRYDVR